MWFGTENIDTYVHTHTHIYIYTRTHLKLALLRFALSVPQIPHDDQSRQVNSHVVEQLAHVSLPHPAVHSSDAGQRYEGAEGRR